MVQKGQEKLFFKFDTGKNFAPDNRQTCTSPPNINEYNLMDGGVQPDKLNHVA